MAGNSSITDGYANKYGYASMTESLFQQYGVNETTPAVTSSDGGGNYHIQTISTHISLSIIPLSNEIRVHN